MAEMRVISGNKKKGTSGHLFLLEFSYAFESSHITPLSLVVTADVPTTRWGTVTITFHYWNHQNGEGKRR